MTDNSRKREIQTAAADLANSLIYKDRYASIHLARLILAGEEGRAGRKPHPSDRGAVWERQWLWNTPGGQRDGLICNGMGDDRVVKTAGCCRSGKAKQATRCWGLSHRGRSVSPNSMEQPAMPTQQCIRRHDEERLLPGAQLAVQETLWQRLVAPGRCRSFDLPFEHDELLA